MTWVFDTVSEMYIILSAFFSLLLIMEHPLLYLSDNEKN